MELFLNILWVVVSLLLFVHWTRMGKRNSAPEIARAVVALLLLIVVLLPIISATDDMVSMAGLEGEHSEHSEHIVRRGELLLDSNAVTPISLAIFTILFVDLAFLRRLLTRVVSRSKAFKMMESFVTIAGIRPPPTTLSLA